MHEDVVLVSECVYRAVTYTGELFVTLCYSGSAAVHHGHSILVEIWACNLLRTAYDHIVCTLFATAAEVVRCEEVVPSVMLEDERSLYCTVSCVEVLSSRVSSHGCISLRCILGSTLRTAADREPYLRLSHACEGLIELEHLESAPE